MATGDTMTFVWKVWNEANTSTWSASSNASITWADNSDGTTTASITWTKWNSNYSISARPVRKTPEELAQQKREAAEKRKREEEAVRKAETLLKECLSPKQEADYEKAKRFHVICEDGHRYEIDCTKRQHNVFRLGEDGKQQEELCISQRGGNLPLPDNALAQKLLLEANEEEFRRIANIRQIA